MRKRLLLLSVSLLAMALSVGAANEIRLCGMTITDELAAGGNLVPTLDAMDNVTATGTVTYNSATQTLVLDNAEITYTPSNESTVLSFATWATDFTIQLKGTNKLTNAFSGYANAIFIPGTNGIYVTIAGEGSLEVTSLNWYAVNLHGGTLTIDHTTVKFNGAVAENSAIGGSLYIKNSYVTATEISRLSAIELTDCSIVQPTGAEIVSTGRTEQIFCNIDKHGSNDDIIIKPTSAGIGAMLTDREGKDNKEWFSLDGRRVEQPQRGLYILNGKKVIVR